MAILELAMSSPDTFFYTFRTNKFVEDIEAATMQKLYIIDKPAKDFDKLVETIKQSGKTSICGVAISKWMTRFEEESFNKSGNGKALKDCSVESTKLSLPVNLDQLGIRIEKRMTAGPCNYVAFRLAVQFPEMQSYFLHVRPKDINKLQALAF
jgi:hypothetical protein